MIWIPRIRIRHTACGIVGAVLQQKEGLRTDWWPLSFFLAKLETAQMSYSAFDLELYGIFVGICYFCYHLEGRNFREWTILCGAPLQRPARPSKGTVGNCRTPSRYFSRESAPAACSRLSLQKANSTTFTIQTSSAPDDGQLCFCTPWGTLAASVTLYDGPYRVAVHTCRGAARSPKVFELELGGRRFLLTGLSPA